MSALLNPTPLINGRRWDFASVEIVVEGYRASACKAINYKRSLKPGEAKGTSPEVLGTTRGTASNEGSFELYKEDFAIIIQLLAAGGYGYMERYFTIVVTYADDLSPAATVDVLQNVRITSAEDSHQTGEEPLSVKCDLFIQRVIENGVSAVSPTL